MLGTAISRLVHVPVTIRIADTLPLVVDERWGWEVAGIRVIGQDKWNKPPPYYTTTIIYICTSNNTYNYRSMGGLCDHHSHQ